MIAEWRKELIEEYVSYEHNDGWSLCEFNLWHEAIKSIVIDELLKLNKSELNQYQLLEFIDDYYQGEMPYVQLELSYNFTLFWIEEWVKKSKISADKFLLELRNPVYGDDIELLFIILVHPDHISISPQFQYKIFHNDNNGNILMEYSCDSRVSCLIMRYSEDNFHIVVTNDEQWKQWLGEINGDFPSNYEIIGIF